MDPLPSSHIRFNPDRPPPAERFTGLARYNFVYGHNDPTLVPVEELASAAERSIRRDGARLALYHMGQGPQGHPDLRAVVARKLTRRRGIDCEADDVLITTGSLQGMDLVNEILVEPGDAVIIEEFTYGAAISKARRAGARVVGAPLDDGGLDVDALRRILADLAASGVTPKYIYTIPTVQNPTGTILSLERRRALLGLAAEFAVPIFEDECYADLCWEDGAPPALYALDPANVIHIGSFSKTLAPALRLGYAVGGWEVLGRMIACKTDAGGGSLDQMVAAEYLQSSFDTHVAELRQGLKRKLDVLIGAVEREFGTSVELSRPRGGIFLWLRFPVHVDVRSFQAAALEAGVAFNPGPEWACDPEAARNYMRLCYALPSARDIEDGVALLARVCFEHTGLPEISGNRARAAR